MDQTTISTTPTPEPVTKLKVWSTVGQSFKSMWHNFVGKFVITTLFVVFYFATIFVATAFNAVLAGLPTSSWLDVGAGGFNFSFVPQDAHQFIIFAISICVALLLNAYVLTIVLGALIKLTVTDQKISFMDAVRQSRKNRWKTLLCAFSLYFIIFLSFFFFVIPGIYYAVALILTLFVFLEEGLSIRESIAKSINYIKGSWWRVFAIIAIGFVVSILAVIVLNIILYIGSVILIKIITGSIGKGVIVYLTLIFTYVLTVLTNIYFLSLIGNTYKKLRALKPNISTSEYKISVPITIAAAGLLIFISLMWLESNILSEMKDRSQRANDQMNSYNQVNTNNTLERAATDKNSSMTEEVGSGADSYMRLLGYGITFNYHKNWVDVGPNKDVNALDKFITLDNYNGKNNGEKFPSAIYFKLFALNQDQQKLGSAYALMKKYYEPTFQDGVKTGIYSHYSLSKYENDNNVALISLQGRTATGEIIISNIYSKVINNHLAIFTIEGDGLHFVYPDIEAEQMILSLRPQTIEEQKYFEDAVKSNQNVSNLMDQMDANSQK